MNSANETLRTIRHQKAILTKKYKRAKKRCTDPKVISIIEEKYQKDIEPWEKEEKQLLEQFKDIPTEEIYKED